MDLFPLNTLNIGLLIVACANILLGALILFRSKLNRISVAYLLVIVSVVGWTVLSILEGSSSSAHALEWARLLYISGILVAVSFVYFALVFPEGERAPRWELFSILGTMILLGLYTFSTDAIIQQVVLDQTGIRTYIFGYGYWIYVAYVLLFFVIGFWLLGHKIVTSVGQKKLQIKYVFIGYLLTTLLGMTSDLILPWLGIVDFLSIGPAFTIIMIAFTYYAMLKHDLMQTRVVAVRTVLYSLLIMAVVGFFTISILVVGRDLQAEGKVSDLFVILATSFIVVIVLDPLKRLLARATDNVFYKDRINYQMLLRKVGETISKQVSQEGLVYSVSKNLALRMKIDFSLIYVHNPQTNALEVLGSTRTPLPLTHPLVLHLQKVKDTIVTEELERIRDDAVDPEELKTLDAVVQEMQSMKIALASPMFSEEQLVGILLLGQKRSGDIYSKEEIDFLEVIAPQIGTALIKARLYDEAKQFNTKLKKEVDNATKELRVANNRLKQLDTAKSEFLSIAAHQLRTPLTGIKGYLSMFLEGDFGKVTKSQQTEMEKIFNSADRLTRLIDVFLNVSRIETGRLELKKTKVKLEEILDSVVTEVEQQAKAKGLKLTIQKPDEALPEVYVDKDKIHDVMMNLTDNAVKYTPQGWVNVRMARSKSLITYEVRDSGIGIAPEEIDKLFQKFSRAEAVSRIHTGGSGLGLFIAKKIIEAHGGRVWAESEGEGKGSMFTFTLPIQETPDAETEEEEAEISSKK